MSELFSVPRITTEAWRFGLRPGWAVDLRTGTDLSQPSERKEVEDQIDRDKLWLTVTSPPCTEHSSLQRFNRPKQDPEKVEARLETSRGHLDFSMRIASKQMDELRYFLHEHPHSADSWQNGSIKKILEDKRVIYTRADLCHFDFCAVPGDPRPSRKTAGLITNSPEIAKMMDKRCQCVGLNPHAVLLNGTAKNADK